MIKKICFIIIVICIIANVMNVVAFSIHRYKLDDIDKCFHEIECKEVDIYGEMKEICYSTECDYMEKWNEYDEWIENGISSFIWRFFE